MVKAGSATLTTDNKGYALFKDVTVSASRITVSAEKASFFGAVKGQNCINGQKSYYFTLVLNPLPTPLPTFQSAAGGSVPLSNGAIITFLPGSIANQQGTPYSGNVIVHAYYYKTDHPDFESMIPGGDLLGLDASGKEVALASFGMLDVKLFDASGNPLNLLPGTTAEIAIQVPASQLANAPATIPLWYLDETTSLWKEEGQATLQGGFYIGNVSHFTSWNYDYPGERANITGKVVDCNGLPMPFVTVTLNGFMNLITDAAGMYSTWVPANWSITYQILTQYNPFLSANSATFTLTASTGQTNQIPDFVLPCATRLIGSFTNCSDEPTGSYVLISNQVISRVYFIEQGPMNIVLPAPGSSNITVSSISGTFDTTVTANAGTPDINIGNHKLCNPVNPILENSFTINGGPFTNEVLAFTPAISLTGTDTNITSFTQEGLYSPGSNPYDFLVYLPGTPVPNATFYITNNSFIAFTMHLSNYTLWCSQPGDLITFHIGTLGTPGQEVTCSFFGNATLYNPQLGVSYPVTITNGYMKFIQY
jgi:hypothetical protein